MRLLGVAGARRSGVGLHARYAFVSDDPGRIYSKDALPHDPSREV